MAHIALPKVTLIAGTTMRNDAREWLQFIGVSEETEDRILDNANKSDAEMLIESAGRRCYKSFEVGLNPNVTKIREDIKEYITNILKAGHGSVLEHVTFSFAIENVSRVFTGEMNRHRAGMAISEGSMRYIRYEDIPYIVPTSIQPGDGLMPESSIPLIGSLEWKKWKSRQIFSEVFNFVQDQYQQLQTIWQDELRADSKFKAKKEITSMMRRIIPMGVATGGIWTGNVRALRHICEMRCSPAAEEEILYIAHQMLIILKLEEPNLFGDFKTSADGFSSPEHKKV